MRANWFIRKGSAFDPSNNTIAALLGRKNPISGDVGLEVEVEGNMFPKAMDYDEDESDDEHLIPPMWNYTHDGSLRGNDNAEYIFHRPLAFDEVPNAVNSLWQMFDDYGSVLDESNRTSVHVHLNAQPFHLNRLASFLGLYFSVEEILVNWCGDHRAGNLFCLRAKDAPAIVGKARKFLKTGDFTVLDDGLHYAGLNLNSLRGKGSVEIRTMRGATEPQVIIDWVSILERLYKLSEHFPDPRLVCAQFSGNGGMAYLQFVLGEHADKIIQGCSMSLSQIMTSVHDGIRIAQTICYCRDWSTIDPSKAINDPFGRTIAQVTDSFNDTFIEDYLAASTASQPVPTGFNPHEITLASIPTPPQAEPISAFSVFQEYYTNPNAPDEQALQTADWNTIGSLFTDD